MLAPYEPDDDQQRAPGVSADRPLRDDRRREQRSDRGRGAQDAEARRADVQDRAREQRQQRDRAAEQDREEIEQDRPEHDLGPADEPQALEHALDARGGGLAGLGDVGRRRGVHGEHRTQASAHAPAASR